MITRLVVGSMATNCYITNGMIIDPGDDAEYIMSHLDNKPKCIVATHGHFDHIMAAYAIQIAYNIPFLIHDQDMFLLSRMQSSAKHFLGIKQVDPPPIPSSLSDISSILVPGHTPGSICVPVDGALIVGDTIFEGGAVGRTDFAYSDPKKLNESLGTILAYHKKTILYPGHGNQTTVEAESHYHRV